MSQKFEKYKESSEKAVLWLLNHFEADGSYGSKIPDLACYYKSPYLFYSSGRLDEAHRMLTHIKGNFLRKDGDFVTTDGLKSENPVFGEYWPYINGWLALTAQKMGRFDVAYPAYRYLKSYYHSSLGGFTTNEPYRNEGNVVDILSIAHLGLVSLYFGDLEKAENAGKLLERFVALQGDPGDGFYLRLDDGGKLIRDFPEESGIFYKVSAVDPDQAYFMIGYPPAFLGRLYQATGDAGYLQTAKSYLRFALKCGGNLRACHLSHKVAWAAAINVNLSREPEFIELALNIADYLLSIQGPSGAWLQEQPAHTSFDQTAEIAIWLREIVVEFGGIYERLT